MQKYAGLIRPKFQSTHCIVQNVTAVFKIIAVKKSRDFFTDCQKYRIFAS